MKQRQNSGGSQQNPLRNISYCWYLSLSVRNTRTNLSALPTSILLRFWLWPVMTFTSHWFCPGSPTRTTFGAKLLFFIQRDIDRGQHPCKGITILPSKTTPSVTFCCFTERLRLNVSRVAVCLLGKNKIMLMRVGVRKCVCVGGGGRRVGVYFEERYIPFLTTAKL